MFNLDILKTFETNELRQAHSLVKTVNDLEDKICKMSDLEIRDQIAKLIKMYQLQNNLEPLIAESFALTREMSRRTLGLRHFDSQILGGCVLNEGKIAEMKTGEGKTLVATLPVVLNALTLKGSHVVTVNDYLAKRDEQWMGQIYRNLGLSVGLIQEGMTTKQRQQSYNADITYVTNSELAFDYLRDNMASSLTELVQRPYNYCIVDEVDSILIDEARTPLIISESLNIPIEKYVVADEITKYLKPDIHFNVNEKLKTITLTNKGIQQAEKILQTTSLYDVRDPWIPYLINALKAHCLFLKDTNYIVKDNEVIIIDEFTGRIMPDRRWGDGLHQAVEAKEKVFIKQGSETLGSITYQNFFRLYPKLAGMTGTAKTAESELQKIYNLDVVVIPTEKPIKRKDLSDLIYADEYTKWKKIAQQSNNLYKTGQPVLIGTVSIEKSEIISQLLKDLEIPHELLNAKPENIKRESEIIAQAGCLKSVTVATNMAGRGTDILLGGNAEFKTKQQVSQLLLRLKKLNSFNQAKRIQLKKQFTKQTIQKIIFLLHHLDENEIEKVIETIIEIKSKQESEETLNFFISQVFEILYQKNKKKTNKEKIKVQSLGGLYVIGTERHESKRIDNQLRGRAGRQGDPGTSRFFLSLDDNLLRIFGGDVLKNLMNNLNLVDEALESNLLTKQLDDAQQKVENYFYDTRKQLFEYDEVLNTQRLAIFKERRAILEHKNVRNEIIHYGEILMLAFSMELEISKNGNYQQINDELNYLFGLSLPLLNARLMKIDSQILRQQFWIRYDLKEAEFENYNLGLIRLLEKNILLLAIDKNWKQHLKELELIKDSIRWRGYGQLNPLTEYKKEGYNLFVETIQSIKYNSIYNLMTSRFS